MSILEIILLVTNLFFGFFCFKFAFSLLRVQEAIEKSLDLIDTKYRRLSEIAKIPVFFDSPEIKSIITEIVRTRDIVLYVASILANSIENDRDVEKLDEESDVEN